MILARAESIEDYKYPHNQGLIMIKELLIVIAATYAWVDDSYVKPNVSSIETNFGCVYFSPLIHTTAVFVKTCPQINDSRPNSGYSVDSWI